MEKNCKTCGGTGWVMRPSIPMACPKGCEQKYEPADISPDLCCGITDSVVSQGGKREMFEKVYVTTVEDLPKDEGYYFVMHIEDDGKDVYYFLPSEDDLIREWITKVEWWLRPVE